MKRALLKASTLALALAFSCGAPLRAQTQQDGATSGVPVIELHSGFWINLHHFLYLEARLRNAAAEPDDRASRASQAQPEYATAPPAGDLTPAEQKAWDAALDAYAKDWSSRDLLGNSDMVIVNNRLAEIEGCSDFSGRGAPQCVPGLRSDLVAALAEAAPIYRAHWWPQQDRENRAWMAAVAPLVHSMGSDLATQLSRVYQHNWTPGRMRVDVVWYAGPQGSYTTLEPTHITIASHDSRNQGLSAFEMLFHEASHTLAAGVNDAIERHCRDLGKPIPRDLWHALLFYTAGELVRQETARLPVLAPNPADTPSAPGVNPTASNASYAPYAARSSLEDHGWNTYEPALERFWQPYLDGAVDFDTAIAHIVSAL
jgi:hypothetical protein